MAAAGVRDTLGALLRRPPHYAPIVGPPGTLGAMTSPDALPGYRAMYPEGFVWRNEVAARVLLATAMYSPGRAAARVRVRCSFKSRRATQSPHPSLPSAQLVAQVGERWCATRSATSTSMSVRRSSVL
jgi:hypothetical protein